MSDLTLSAEESTVLKMIADGLAVAEILKATGWSNGRLHRFKVKHRARKYEDRIALRASEIAALQRSFLDDVMNTTVEGDVLDVLESLPSNSVQVCVTSPPYNCGKKYGGFDCDRKAHQKYRGWMIQLISEFARVLRVGGTIVLQVGSTKDDDGNTWPLDVVFFEELLKADLRFQNRISWPVHHGLTPKNRLAERGEVALVFSKGEPLFNKNAARIPQLHPGKRAFHGQNKGKLSGHPLGAAPTDQWGDIKHLAHNHPEKTNHIAQFPVSFAKRAILLYSLPSDIVLDPFSGSGSTAVAAVATGRNFVGSDLFYSGIRAARLAAAGPDTVTPLTGVTRESMAVWAAEARRVDKTCATITDAADVAQIVMEFDVEAA